MVIKEGADIVKTYVTGEGMIFECTAEEVTYSEEEIRVICEEAHRRNRRVSAHSRGAEGCKISVRAGVDILDHGTLVDEEAIDLVAATKWGSELMRMEDRIGTLEPGKLADLLLVDGNPLQDIRILQDRSRLALVMQGGRAMAGTLGLQHA